MNKNLITFENKLIKVLLKNIYKKIDVEITYQFVNPYQLITKELKILKNSKIEISSTDLRNLNYYSLRKKGILLINNLVNIDRKYFNKKTNNMSYLSIPEKTLENMIKKRQIKTRSILLAAYAYLYVNYQFKSGNNYSLYLSQKLNYSENYIKSLTKELFKESYLTKNVDGVPGGLISTKTIKIINSQKFQQIL
jgi:hypothetical protein|tara:strand:+ start:194 stop:775 length:582 start_codon:yes stop_codon:yes gene_type:complete